MIVLIFNKIILLELSSISYNGIGVERYELNQFAVVILFVEKINCRNKINDRHRIRRYRKSNSVIG